MLNVPQGQRRPADAVGIVVMVAKVATGEIEETRPKKSGRTKSGQAGAKARAEKRTAEERSDIVCNYNVHHSMISHLQPDERRAAARHG